ncbi:MAG: phage tail protein I [Treponema sp.]|nr:phage tail protein I [Treponema sp.]
MELSNVSILNLLPPNIANDNNVKMMAEAFNKTLHDIINKIPDLAIIPNLMLDKIVNETLVDLLAWQFHVDFYQPDLPLNVKIELVKKSLDWHTRKGTPSTIEEIVTEIFAEAKIEEWYEYKGLPHHFRVTVGDFLPDSATIAKITRAINSVKNTRSFLDIMTSIIIFHDELPMEESNTMVGTLHTTPDTLSQKVKRNGRVLRNGKTVFDTELTHLFRNGNVKRNGIERRNGTQRVLATGAVFQPVKRSSGIQDTFLLGIGNDHTDEWKSIIYRKGSIQRNGTIKRNSLKSSILDSPSVIQVNVFHTDKMTITDLLDVAVENNALETINRNIKRDGSQKRNGILARSSNGIVDPFVIDVSGDIKETENIKVADSFSISMIHHYFRDGTRRMNGSFKRNSMILIPLE